MLAALVLAVGPPAANARGWDEDDACDDSDACTIDSCQGLSGCEHLPDPGITCLPNAACDPATGNCLCGGVLCEATGTNCCIDTGRAFVCDPDPCDPDTCAPSLLACVIDCSEPSGNVCEAV